jgi:murein DD-endopeptidase MepM/ murein hydrolase activator NlpD
MSLNQDFQPPRHSGLTKRRQLKGQKIIIFCSLFLCAVMTFFFLSSETSPDLEARETPVEVSAPVVIPEPPQPVREESKNRVPSGSSITALLGDYFSAQEIYKLNEQSRDIFPFTKIIAGQPYRIVTIDGRFDSFVYEIDSEEELTISRRDDQLSIVRQDIIYDVVVENIQGVITTSLFDAINTIGEKPELAFILADIFGWDINFILDIRVGDTFQSLVQKRFRDGEFAGYGRVLAAEFINQGESFKAFRFKDGNHKNSFYNEKGENLRKAFLKAPLSFTRISSGYSTRRMHPIKKVWKSHPAIDYVAPIGTPIKTVGDGTITRKGYTRANGNFVEITHSNGYSAIYLHMNGFARGMKKGKRVTQGQRIGYVGQTGLATGPHLCFRMRRYGKPVNPLRLKVPSAKSVSSEHIDEFHLLIEPLLAKLSEKNQPNQVALLPQAEAESTQSH